MVMVLLVLVLLLWQQCQHCHHHHLRVVTMVMMEPVLVLATVPTGVPPSPEGDRHQGGKVQKVRKGKLQNSGLALYFVR